MLLEREVWVVDRVVCLFIFGDSSKIRDNYVITEIPVSKRILNFNHAMKFLHNSEIWGLCFCKLCGSGSYGKFILAQAFLENTNKENPGSAMTL